MWGCQSFCAVIKTLHTNVPVCLQPIDDPIHTPPIQSQVQVYLEFVFAPRLHGEEIWVADLGGDHLAHMAGSGCGLLGPITLLFYARRSQDDIRGPVRKQTPLGINHPTPALPMSPRANPACATWDWKAALNLPFSPLNTHGWATGWNGWMGPNMGLINGRETGGQGLPTHPQNKIICIYIHSVTLFLGPVDKHRLVFLTRIGSTGACWAGRGLEWLIDRKHCCVCAATVEVLCRVRAGVGGVASGSFYFILFFYFNWV